ncbi:AraC family transcriptional regulator [Microlunatus phosphovorus NM-1] [Mycolicibacterium parafortuitum]|uniref:AraC family transcriptional regulator [Microlunatus phosphovorus NM-1] n=2 Tax=Mycolicibacterium parafortuitum TaxID=39692 RepID=A0A375YQM3_MYCPF|nr:AraC family transcriptional regulator [Microlunatus phosphovorus NM-1] [Mycolicibacterium parafortuitum]
MFDLRRWAADGVTARYVEHFWSVSWDLRDKDPFDNTVITFPSLHLTHEWGEDRTRHGFPLPNTLVHGVVEQVFRTTIRARGWVVGARFRPGGFTARFGGDASALTGRVEPVAELFGAVVEVPDDVDGAAAELDRLIGRGAAPDAVYPVLARLVDRIRDDSGIHRVDQVMTHSPWSVRTTQRVFRRYVGVPVKWVLCRYRLQNAALQIESDPGVDFADLAVRLGWYDQAHFINDFRAMLGCTPGEYAARYGTPR